MLLLLLLLSQLIDSFGDTLNGAFCRKNLNEKSDFPLAVPKHFAVPWVWDAVYNNKLKSVAIVTVARRACDFNHTMWHEGVRHFPQFSKFFAYGLEENILVASEDERTGLPIGERMWRAFDQETLKCMYYQNGQQLPVAIIMSEENRGTLTWMELGTATIVCPTPNVKFDFMKLGRIGADYFNATRDKQSKILESKSLAVSESFQVCRRPDLSNSLTNFRTDRKGRYYDISVCTASDRFVREDMVEWLEYYKLLGVDHFFIYNTALENQEYAYHVLEDYIKEGFVTVVGWPYENCVKGMASGRYTLWRLNGTKSEFRPPKAIAQSGALSSCMTRFKRFTEYMMHIDDDEFIGFNTTVINDPNNNQKERSTRPLLDYANRIFRENPKAAALSFFPVSKHYCPLSPNLTIFNENEMNMPRLGNWTTGNKMVHFEGKLLMKASAVRMFFIHYLAQLEPNTKYDETHRVDINDAALLHYKFNPELLCLSPWGLQNLADYTPRVQSPVCDIEKHQALREGFRDPAQKYPDYVSHIDHISQGMLLKKYRERMLNYK